MNGVKYQGDTSCYSGFSVHVHVAVGLRMAPVFVFCAAFAGNGFSLLVLISFWATSLDHFLCIPGIDKSPWKLSLPESTCCRLLPVSQALIKMEAWSDEV